MCRGENKQTLREDNIDNFHIAIAEEKLVSSCDLSNELCCVAVYKILCLKKTKTFLGFAECHIRNN